MRKSIYALLAAGIVCFQPLLAEDIPLWERQQQLYQQQYAAKNYPGKQRQYEAELAKARAANVRGEALAAILYSLADSLFNQYKFFEAEPYYREALSIREGEPDCDTKKLADSIYRVAYCCMVRAQRGQKQYLPESLALYKQSTDMLETKYGPQCIELQGPLSGWSVAVLQNQDWQQAARIQERLNKIFANQHGAISRINAAHYQQLSIMKQNAGLTQEAAQDLQKYKEIKAKLPPGSLPPDSYEEWTRWAERRLTARQKPVWLTDLQGRPQPEEPLVSPALSASQATTPPPMVSQSLPPVAPAIIKPPAVMFPPKAGGTPALPAAQPRLPSAQPRSHPDLNHHYYVAGKEVNYERYCAIRLYNESLPLLKQQKLDEAQKKLEEAVNLDPQLADAHCNLGLILAKSSNYEQALIQLQEAVTADNSLLPAWGILANIYQSMGNLKDAIQSYQKLVELAPNDEMAERARSSIRLFEKELQRRQVPSKLAGFPGSDDRHDYLAYITRQTAARWTNARLPVKVFVHRDAKADGYLPSFDARLREAFQEWASASNNKISFAYVNNPSSADIDVLWTSDTGQLNEPAEGGEAQTIIIEPEIRRAKIILLTYRDLQKEAVNESEMKAVALHEIGHAIGMQGHSPLAADIMYCAEGLSQAPQDLTERDRNTIRLLYSWQPQAH